MDKFVVILNNIVKRELTIRSSILGSIEPSEAPISLGPFPIALPVAFKTLVIEPTTAPILTHVEKNSPHCHIVFFEISLFLSERGRAIFSTWVYKRASSSFISAYLSYASRFSEGVVVSSWMISWRCSFSRCILLSRQSLGLLLKRHPSSPWTAPKSGFNSKSKEAIGVPLTPEQVENLQRGWKALQNISMLVLRSRSMGYETHPSRAADSIDEVVDYSTLASSSSIQDFFLN